MSTQISNRTILTITATDTRIIAGTACRNRPLTDLAALLTGYADGDGTEYGRSLGLIQRALEHRTPISRINQEWGPRGLICWAMNIGMEFTLAADKKAATYTGIIGRQRFNIVQTALTTAWNTENADTHIGDHDDVVPPRGMLADPVDWALDEVLASTPSIEIFRALSTQRGYLPLLVEHMPEAKAA